MGDPQKVFLEQEERFGPFDLDVCASELNNKCIKYYCIAQNDLTLPWKRICWMNPPYGREIKSWVEYAVEQVRRGVSEKVVCLLPARTDTAWWHDFVEPYAKKIEFVRGRLKFEGTGFPWSAPFPSVVVVF